VRLLLLIIKDKHLKKHLLHVGLLLTVALLLFRTFWITCWSQCCYQGLKTRGQGQGLEVQGRGQGQGQGLVKWSSIILLQFNTIFPTFVYK